ncbi:single-stranded DNA-binding protein [Actinomycetospora termitidis]|uniref:Single-stranded DNA-binding protein n=1 Tax=Actinomycetospora termitidis TaxID=3053470 RepID=A0ABT7MIT3_9PSEU|nr:single-stranded DNA-binding protein [Actinomycetospora sp. Odt1-22]MDL5160531.1 single-stranded DNA-binding protein [Actinomycetospora sp. Odt1-22]
MSTAIQVTGNLTADPELQYPPNGRAAARFTVAVNARRRTEAGEWVDGEPTFYPVETWGEQGEHVAESLTRGAQVVVLGTVKARSWAPTEGERGGKTLTRLEVTAETVAASLQWATLTVTTAKRVGSWARRRRRAGSTALIEPLPARLSAGGPNLLL